MQREDVEQAVAEIFSPVAHFLHHHEEAEEDQSDDESMASPEVSADDDFNPWLFIKCLPPYETVVTVPKALPDQDPSETRKTLVLDLDETLVHCSVGTIVQRSFSILPTISV